MKYILIAFALVCSFSINGQVKQKTVQPKVVTKDAVYYFDRGFEKFSGEVDPEGAILDFDKAIKLNPKYSDAYLYRGMAKGEIYKYAEAILDLDKSIKLTPGNSLSYRARAGVKGSMDDYKGAITDYTKSIQLSPGDLWSYAARGGMQKELKNYNEAIADYTIAIEMGPGNAEHYYFRGLVKQKMDDYPGAIKDFTSAIENDTKYTDAYISSGLTKIMAGDREGACADFTKAEEFDEWGDLRGSEMIKQFCGSIAKKDIAVVPIDVKPEERPIKEVIAEAFSPEKVTEPVDLTGKVKVFEGAKGLYGLTTSTGKVIAEAKYERIHWAFYDGLCQAKKDGKWGYINESGIEVIPYIYDKAEGFFEELGLVSIDNKWGFVDKLGKVVISIQYDGAEFFSGGKTKVTKGNKSFYIDKTGNRIK